MGQVLGDADPAPGRAAATSPVAGQEPASTGCYDQGVSAIPNVGRRGLLALVAGLGIACAGETPGRSPAPTRQAAPASSSSAPVVERLDTARADIPPPDVQRNPFRFARRGGDAPRDRQRFPPAESLPELPLPGPPPLRLLGIATREDGSRVAVISSAGDLVLARVGDRLAGNFSVTRIGPDGVDLADELDGRTMRLSLP